MTISAGESGLILFGSPPRAATASRMVARSTMQGTPVKSCMTTRAGRELDLGVGLGRGIPDAERLDLLLRDVRAVFGAQQVLERAP